MKTYKKDPATIKILKEWLNKPGNSTVKLAAGLNYKASSTVGQWIRRGRVPDREKDKIIQFINGNK